MIDQQDNDSGYYSSVTSESHYEHDLDQVLQKYETAAQYENYYLLHTTFPAGAFEIGCGLSPARTFSPAVILRQPYKTESISFGHYEWMDLLEMLKLRNDDFFNEPLNANIVLDDYEPVTYSCGMFCTVTKLIFDDTKFIEIRKHGMWFCLTQDDVMNILEVTDLVTRWIGMLEQLDFMDYYIKVLDIIRPFFISNNDLWYVKLQNLLDLSNNVMLSNGLREYLFYYKNKFMIALQGFAI